MKEDYFKHIKGPERCCYCNYHTIHKSATMNHVLQYLYRPYRYAMLPSLYDYNPYETNGSQRFFYVWSKPWTHRRYEPTADVLDDWKRFQYIDEYGEDEPVKIDEEHMEGRSTTPELKIQGFGRGGGSASPRTSPS